MDEKLYPQIVPEEEVFKMIDEKTHKTANVYRIKAIKDFINKLKNDYIKYNNRKKSIV